MEKITLKELAPYLPYGLKIYDGEYLRKLVIHSTTYHTDAVGLSRLFIPHYDHALGLPVLRPLSDLTKRINDDESNLTYQAYFKFYTQEDLDYAVSMPLGLDYETVQGLIEWHFDVFGLIPKNLAIDKNTLTASTPQR